MKIQTEGNPQLEKLQLETGRFCFDLWRDPLHGRLLVFAGSNGAAKTLCAKDVRDWIKLVGHGKQFIRRSNVVSHVDCVFWEWAKLIDHFKNGGWDVIDDMFEVTVLIIDDLGAGHDPSAAGTDKLCQVLSRREQMWTLITTNIGPDAWQEKFDRRVASRLFRNSTLVDLSDVPDYCV